MRYKINEMPGTQLVISEELKNKLESWPVHKVLVWASFTFGSKVAATSSFQSQSLPLLHLISRFCPDLNVVFVDTGYHFPETLSFRDSVTSSLNLNLKVVQSEATAPQFEQLFGQLYYTNPDRCCTLRKISPLENALSRYQAWISGIRQDQTESRKKAEIIEFHGDIVKINPLIHWSQAEIDRYIQENHLPKHPLESKGFRSIGCYPCTQAVNQADSFRYGRWIGFDKTECGIHCESSSIYPTTVKLSKFRVE